MANQMTKSIMIKGNAADLYRILMDFESLPSFLKSITSVLKLDEHLTHWVMEGPMGKRIEWDAEITRMDENKRIGWNSRGEGDITTSGQVTFNQITDDQVEVTITLQYVPQGGLTNTIGGMFSNPEAQLEQELHNFKAYAEGRYERIAV